MIQVIHNCTGPLCLACAMVRRGYVRSAVVNRWWMPDRPREPWLTDDEARASLQPGLFDGSVPPLRRPGQVEVVR